MISASAATAYATKRNIVAPVPSAALESTLETLAAARANEALNPGLDPHGHTATIDTSDLLVTRADQTLVADPVQHLSD